MEVQTRRSQVDLFMSDGVACLRYEYIRYLCDRFHQSALIAQLVERVTSNDEVAGSTPS